MEIFDRHLLRQHLAKAQNAFPQHDFLWQHSARQIQDRLLDIKRDFNNALEISLKPYVLTTEFLQQKRMGDVYHAAPLTGHADLVLDEEFWPVRHHSLDALVALNQLHWVNDVPGALTQFRQSLRPDGVVLGSFFGGETGQELRQVLAMAETEIYGGISPRVSPFISLPDMAALMQRAQFALPVVDHDLVTVTYDSFFKLLGDIRGMGQNNAVLKRNTRPLTRQFWQRAAELYATHFSNKDGRLTATVELIYFLGWAPADNQPKPLARGSATHRLVDVLK